MKAIRRILMTTDFSACAHAAGALAGQLARQLNAEVDVVTVIEPARLTDVVDTGHLHRQDTVAVRDEARTATLHFASRHFARSEHVRLHVRDGDAATEIMRASRDLDSDLIVLGTHGRTGLEHLLIGSVAEAVVRRSTVPVMTVRRGT